MSVEVLAGVRPAMPAVLADPAFYVALLLAVFAILFGTRQIDATEHHRGMVLAVALESLVKLIAFIAIGVFALFAPARHRHRCRRASVQAAQHRCTAGPAGRFRRADPARVRRDRLPAAPVPRRRRRMPGSGDLRRRAGCSARYLVLITRAGRADHARRAGVARRQRRVARHLRAGAAAGADHDALALIGLHRRLLRRHRHGDRGQRRAGDDGQQRPGHAAAAAQRRAARRRRASTARCCGCGASPSSRWR